MWPSLGSTCVEFCMNVIDLCGARCDTFASERGWVLACLKDMTPDYHTCSNSCAYKKMRPGWCAIRA